MIPAYKEEENIGLLIEDIVAIVHPLTDDLEIVVVDDGSPDGTAAVVREKAAQYPQVRLIQHEVNQGFGGSLYTALTNATKDLVFYTDADRQFDVAEIVKLLSFIGEHDLVIGYRAPRRDPFMRRFNGWGWSTLATLLFGYTARDIDCAFKLMRREVIDCIKDKMASRGATFSAEFLVRAKRAGFRIREVPIHGHRPRVAGSPTGARPGVIIRAFKELVRFRIALWREDKAA